MFDRLSENLQQVFKRLKGHGRLSESNVAEAMREVRLALLEADVHYEVARDFIASVKERSLGEEVLSSITPGQQVIKIFSDELTRLLGGTATPWRSSGRPAGTVLLGLHGSGKTTTTGKLAGRWKKEGHEVWLAACDIRRPAAVDQLRVLAEQVGVRCIEPQPGESVPAVAVRALREADQAGADRIIFDTGGRFQIDEELVDELKALCQAVKPSNTVLVLDAAVGQEAVEIARRFHEAVGLTGLILTKLDGDARGGAALSVRSVTGCPILMVGVGERADDLQPFYPDRMASRILGMGDIVSLVEQAQAEIDVSEAERVEARIRKNKFDLEDFLAQMQQMKKMGPLDRMLDMLPGVGAVPAGDRAKMVEQSGQDMKRFMAIIQSMTPMERRRPERLDASRKKRIARGSGTEVRELNTLLRRFDEARKMMKRFKGMQKMLRRPGALR